MYSQVTDYPSTLTNFKNEQDNGRYGDVKAYADKYRPHIEQHLARADSITKAIFPK